MGKHAIVAVVALVALGCGPGADEGPSTGPEEGEAEGAEAVGQAGPDPWGEVEVRASSAGSAFDSSGFLAALGGALFRAPVPTGNGRACATCHVPEKNFTISPAEIEKRFKKNPKDPLFRSIDADDFANDFTTVRTKGLFRVTLPLPPNVTLAADPAATSVQLWRAVPTVQNVKLTAPYTHDGRALALDEQARGAALEHSRPSHVAPPLAFDLIALFQERQFSSGAVKNVSALVDAGQAPPAVGSDYDAPLTALEQEGLAAFNASFCNLCHNGNLRNAVNPGPFPSGFTTVMVSEFNNAGLPVLDFDVANADGTVTRVSSPDPGRLLVTGAAKDANTFDSTQLRGVGKTAPYFHDNSAADLTEVLRHYNRVFPFFNLPTIPESKFPALVAYMQRL